MRHHFPLNAEINRNTNNAAKVVSSATSSALHKVLSSVMGSEDHEAWCDQGGEDGQCGVSNARKRLTALRGRAPHFIQTHAGILAKSWTRGPVSYANLLISLARPRGIEPLFSP